MRGAIIIEGHIQGLSNVRSIGELGVPVYVVDTNTCIAKYSKYCGKFFVSPSYDSAEFIDFLIDLGEKENLQDWLLYPSNDFSVMNIYRNLERLKPYYIFFENSVELIELIYNKETLTQFAQNIGIHVPKIVDNNSFQPINYPIITRGKIGLSFYKNVGKKVFVSKNQEEFAKVKQSLNNKIDPSSYFSQELLSSINKPNTVSYVVFAEQGEVKNSWMGEKLRQHPWSFGTATFARSYWFDECAENGNKLIKALKYTGVCEIEFQYDDTIQAFALIEINARTWLWVELAKQSGVDFAKIIYSNLTKNSNLVAKDNFQKDVYWRNIYTDVFIVIKAFFQRRLKLQIFPAYNKKKKVRAILQYSDLKPSFAFIFLIPKIILKR